MTALLIRVDCDDESDLDWLRHRCVAAVEDVVETNREEERLDGEVVVSWEVEDE